jgi:Ca-activated chloride channel family protein
MNAIARHRWLFGLSLILHTLALATPKPGPSEVLKKVDSKLAGGSPQYNFPSQQLATGPDADKTLAPYFHVPDGDAEQLPLKETSSQVDIAGVIARVRIKQVFENHGRKPIEAIYVFPGSTRAAVHGMRMRIGERTLEAKIDKKEAARKIYEAAKSNGQRASLLEQQRPNVFTMNVANLMPKDRIEVELEYSELIVPEDATYEFVLPTVVGPRYGGGADPKKDQWIANPYLKEGQPSPYKFDVRLHVETGIALKELVSPSHKVSVNYTSSSGADVTLAEPNGGATKDFIVRYRLSGDRIETGLLLFPGEKENFFALMLEPPRRPTVEQLPPREYIFVLDVSGSMHGFPLNTAKELMGRLLSQLKPTDTFNVVLFSGASHVMSPKGSIAANASNIRTATDMITRQQGGGGTELLGALRNAYAVPKSGQDVSRSVVVVTDGYVGVEAASYKFIREHLNEANLFAFGIGSSVNSALIEGMARAGQGEPFVVLNEQGAREEAEKLRKYIAMPVLSNIQVRFHGFDAYEIAPDKSPDLLAQRPVIVFGKYRGQPSGRIELTGFTGQGRHSQSLVVDAAAAKASNAALRFLWARKWVEILEDQHHLTPAQEIVDSIVDLGLTYTLLTPFTSFVAVDSVVANKTGQSTPVNQPLPLPEGVSNMAVGGAAPSAPPPAQTMGALGMRKKMSAPAREESEADMGMSDSSSYKGRGMASAPSPAKSVPADSERKAAKEETRAKDDASANKVTVSVESAPTGMKIPDVIAEVTRWVVLERCAVMLEARIEIVLDKDGKVLSAKILSGDASGCLRSKLSAWTGRKLSSGAGTVRFSVRIQR